MHYLLLVVLSCAVLAGGEGKGYPFIDWKKLPAANGGESRGELKHPATSALIMRYRVLAPETLPKQRTLGLIVGFHGAPGDENFLSGVASGALGGVNLAQNYVIAAGKSVGVGWKDADEPMVMQWIDWLMTVYPIDRRRVFIWGASNGGHMSAWFASRHTDIFAGAVASCGYGLPVPDGKDPATGMLEYYICHGDKDDAVNVSGSRRFRTDLWSKGFRGVYREINGGGHPDPVFNQPVLYDTAKWINVLRHKQIAVSDVEAKWLKTVGSEALAKEETWSELVRIGGAPAWTVASRAQKSPDAAARLALAKACSSVFFAGEETVSALVKLTGDKDAPVQLAAIEALAMHAAWRTASAQTALAKLAQNAKNPAAARVAAAKGLAGAMPLVLLGNCSDDPALFDAVNALLESDNADVRTAISAPLLAVVKEFAGYAPEGDAAARKTAIAAWKVWLEAQRDADVGKEKPQDKPKKK